MVSSAPPPDDPPDPTAARLEARAERHRLRHHRELRRETNTMAIYVAICSIAGLVALPSLEALHPHLVVTIWGFALGLAVTHWFAFVMASHLVGQGRVTRADLELGLAQFVGAAVIAGLATVATLLFPEHLEIRAIGITLSAFIAAVAYQAIRSGGGTHWRAGRYAATALLAAMVVVELKLALSGK